MTESWSKFICLQKKKDFSEVLKLTNLATVFPKLRFRISFKFFGKPTARKLTKKEMISGGLLMFPFCDEFEIWGIIWRKLFNSKTYNCKKVNISCILSGEIKLLICSTLPSLSYYIHRLRHAKQRYQVLIEVQVFPKHQSLNADESSVKKEPLMRDQWEIFFFIS